MPTAPIICDRFEDLVKTIAYKKGMPNQRFTYVPHPISNVPASVCRGYIEGNDPLTGKLVVEELIAALTDPLTEEDKKTGFIERSYPRLLEPDTTENLERLFVKNGWTDGLPIVLPTEESVAEMLKGTSHSPDEVVATMRPSPPHEAWSYNVEQVAVNAVMAGAKPEYFPVILAIASTGVTSLFTSTCSFSRMVVVNGPIRNEIKMNSEIGAMGPFNEANATIGRAWTFISKNLGGGGQPGTTYLGSQGNSLNYNNICFPENEEASPWEPFHVQKLFSPEDSVVSVFTGFGMINYGSYLPYPHHEVISVQLRGFISFGEQATVLLDPTVAVNLKEVEGFDTKGELSQWLKDNTKQTTWEYWPRHPEDLKAAEEGVEPYASWLELPEGAVIPVSKYPPQETVNIIVVGGGTNPYFQALNHRYLTSASVDNWR